MGRSGYFAPMSLDRRQAQPIAMMDTHTWGPPRAAEGAAIIHGSQAISLPPVTAPPIKTGITSPPTCPNTPPTPFPLDLAFHTAAGNSTDSTEQRPRDSCYSQAPFNLLPVGFRGLAASQHGN
ncbi:hypothetical protein AAFF_G00332660 [Aldrovandia affinis]|uniref:Uncharacterized protein n=1 Tax=Aldrovandia affinis TaxID=143900 RepID=A0AAD7WQR1_9TELE|nr:hypothetical protein AAFF_G00332660 [Aldrovandia affinis]